MGVNIPWLELKNIEAWLENRIIFESLNITLNINENTAVIGPNGAGKSSLVKLIDRSIYPVVKKDSHIRLFGKERINLWDLRSNIGFLSTELEDRVYPEDKVIDVICSGFNGYFGRQIDLNPSNSQIDKAREVLNQLNLMKFSDMIFRHLSDGIRRKTLIGRAIVNEPKILVLDEPVCRLDLRSKHELLNTLDKRIKAGTTILNITHDITTILKTTDRVILLKKGKVFSDGTPEYCLTNEKLSNLYETPLIVSSMNGYWQIFPDD